MSLISSGLCLISRVGGNYGVIDITDGVIEWVTKEDLIKYSKVCKIAGVDTSTHSIAPVSCRVNADKCNWASNKANIFTSSKSVFFNKNTKEIVFITDGSKKFKGKVQQVNMQGVLYYTITFYGHVIVFFSPQQFNSLVERAV